MFVRASAALLLLVALASALPRDRETRQIGFFAPPWAVPGDDYSGSESSEEVGSAPGYSSLGTMLQGMQVMMTRLRQQLADSMTRFPVPSVPHGVSFPHIQIPQMPNPFKPSDAGFDGAKPTNSTSKITVVGGHKVTVNETTYASEDGASVFRIKTVDVSPNREESAEKIPAVPETIVKVTIEPESVEKVTEPESAETIEIIETPTGEVLEIEKMVEEVKPEVTSSEIPLESSTSSSITKEQEEDNEIPQAREGSRMMSEAWQQDDEPIAAMSGRSAALQQAPWGSKVYPEWPNFPRLASKWRYNSKRPFMSGYKPLDVELRGYKPSSSDVELIPGLPARPIDLSSDLRVNQLLSERANAGALIMPDPDSEFVELKDGKLIPSIQSA